MAPFILNLGIRRGKRLSSRPGRFFPGESARGINSAEGLFGPQVPSECFEGDINLLYVSEQTKSKFNVVCTVHRVSMCRCNTSYE